MDTLSRCALAAAALAFAAASTHAAPDIRKIIDEYGLFGDTAAPPLRARDTIAAWPEHSRDMARVLIEEYGRPATVEKDRLTWLKKRPWKKIVVFRDPQGPGLPGILLQSVAYEVPVARWQELSHFERGVSYDAAGRELTARSDSAPTNILALNLAYDVIRGRRSAAEATAFYDKTLKLSFAGKSSPYMRGLIFRPR